MEAYKMDWNHYLNKELECSCGRTHRCAIKHVAIGLAAIASLTAYIKEKGYQHVAVVVDKNTEKAAGETVYGVLEKGGIFFDKIRLEAAEIIPDEITLGNLIADIAAETDLIIAVGSGTINDSCRFISHKMKIDYFIVGTAPSMDGYASDVTPMLIHNLKITYEKMGHAKAILGDVDVLSKAPMRMITAGVGDVFGKYICLTEWKLSHLITGEYYCEFVDGIMQDALKTLETSIDGIPSRNKKAMGAIMEGLVLAGVGMSYVGNSRPASGSEHHLAHYWEMMFLQSGQEDPLHGTKVGVGTVIALLLYQYAKKIVASGKAFPQPSFDEKIWVKSIKKAYGISAPGVLSLEENVHKNSDAAVAKRLAVLQQHREDFMKLANALPTPEKIIVAMKKIQAPYLPKEIGVTPELLKNSIIYAKELRNRYGILQLLFDMGELENAADCVCKQIEQYK